jgi:hypothetical protein
MLAVIALLRAAERAARLLCERSRASVAAGFFAGLLKSLRNGIVVCIVASMHAEGLTGSGGDVELAIPGVQDVVQVGLGIGGQSGALRKGGGDLLCSC